MGLITNLVIWVNSYLVNEKQFGGQSCGLSRDRQIARLQGDKRISSVEAQAAGCPVSQNCVRFWTATHLYPLWMAGDRNDCDDSNSLFPFNLIGAVMPEDSIGARGVVLGIGFEDLLAVRARELGEFVSMKARVVRVDFQVSESLPNLIEERGTRRRVF